MQITPELVSTGLSVIFGIWQALNAKKYRAATGTLVDAIEQAAVENNARSVKNVVAIKAAAQATKATIDAVLERKGYREPG